MQKKRKKLSKKELTRRQKIRQRAKSSTKKIKREIKKAISTAIVAAFGFIIALAWKDVITEYVESLMATSPISGKLISALIVTFIAVIGILIITRFLKVEE